MRRTTAVFAGMLLANAVLGADAIGLAPPVVHPVPDERVTLLFEQAVAIARLRYGHRFEIGPVSENEGSYMVRTTAILSGEEPMMTVGMTFQGREETYPLVGAAAVWSPDLLAGAIHFLWAGFNNYLEQDLEEPPVLIDELPTSVLAEALMPPGWTLLPLSVAVGPGGILLAGFSTNAVAFDPDFRVVGEPGRELYEQGNYTFAGGIATTPAGTIFFKPSAGREIYRLAPGSLGPEKWRAGMQTLGAFVALSDGSVVMIDIEKRRAFRIDGSRRIEIPLFSGPNSWINTLAAGPEGNIWAYHQAELVLRVHAPDGRVLDSIAPVVNRERTSFGPSSMAVYGDGRFVVFSSGTLYCFRRDGSPIWRLDEIGGENLPTNTSVAVDSDRGFVYLTDTAGRLIKLLDTAYVRDHGIVNESAERTANLTRRYVENPRDLDALREKARMYDELNAPLMAIASWQRVLDEAPFDAAAQHGLDRAEITVLTTKAEGMRRRTLETLRELGPESSRLLYSQTLQIYERILGLSPHLDEVRRHRDDLKRQFQMESGSAPEAPPLRVVSTEVEELFPSMMLRYRDHAVGSIVLENRASSSIDLEKVSFHIKRYMDYPTEGRVGRSLAPGSTSEVPLYVVLSTEVLTLQEDLAVQAAVEISYTVDNRSYAATETISVLLHRRTALVWDSSAKLAPFFTPRESTVSEFALAVADVGQAPTGARFPERFLRAIRIIEGVGDHGIAYIEDPDSPITKVLGRQGVVDTVRFPRTTLKVRTGDCDDTTALLGSLLESAGIRTAIMTSPGHVFLAFAADDGAENGWLYEAAGLSAIRYHDEVWIPIETTALDEGFFQAWHHASDLVDRYQGSGQIEFLPIETLREEYAPIPLPPSGFVVPAPTDSRVATRYADAVANLDGALHRDRVRDLRAELASVTGRKAVRLENRIGAIQARFGDDSDAENTLRHAMETDPSYFATYVNLANLKLSTDDSVGAIDILESGLAVKPDSVLLNLLLARAHQSTGNQDLARRHFSLVREKAPRLADRYEVHLGGEGEAGRATRAGIGEFPLIWSESD